MSLSLPEGSAEAIRARVGEREFSAFIAAAVERELCGLAPPEPGALRTACRPGGDEEVRADSRLLMDAGLHGYKYASAAAVAEAALRPDRPVVMVTSMTKLCGERVRLVAV